MSVFVLSDLAMTPPTLRNRRCAVTIVGAAVEVPAHGGPRILSPTNGLENLGATISCNTSTICYNNGTFNVQSTPGGLDLRSFRRKSHCTRRHNTHICIAYGILPHGGRVRTVHRCINRLGSANISTLVISSVNIVVVTHRITPGLRLRMSARTNIAGCRTTGTFCRLNTHHIILTHRVSLRTIHSVHTGVPSSLSVRYFIRNTVYVTFSNHYLFSGCLANHSNGRNRYTRPYH